MIRKAVLALMFLALVISMGCSSTPQTPVLSQVTTVTSMSPFTQNTIINTAFTSTLSVTVTTNGTPVVGETVTFTAPGAGAGGTFANGNNSATGTTNASGVATSPVFTADGTVGTYNIVATVQSAASTASFSMSNTLIPEAVSSTAGAVQSQTSGTEFGTQLGATVVNGSAAPVSGLVVTFTAPATGASGYFIDSDTNTTTAITNSSGVATAAKFVAGTAGGPYTVTASYSTGGFTGQTDFTLTNNP